MLKGAAADFPSRVAVAVPGRLELTHAALDALVDAAAARLVADAGVLPGHVVPLSFPNTVELVIMVLAIVRARGVAALLDPAYTQEKFRVLPLRLRGAPPHHQRRGQRRRAGRRGQAGSATGPRRRHSPGRGWAGPLRRSPG
ncbi:hypothetical protein BAE44_0014336 [Dichanthelium oligosanthes]|uniref:AMP-dependent synthetase/ligase domain-containing protein n=1 Tax=Dichanthelium oligosanthes TaxID=888268 RepID=A0A1E5VHP4_9POAL|nr:hypothetical protein BAE44_0014336 [Dichanthelium oligosanthes]